MGKMTLTKKQIEQASRKANKNRIIPDGGFINRMERANKALKFKPLRRRNDFTKMVKTS